MDWTWPGRIHRFSIVSASPVPELWSRSTFSSATPTASCEQTVFPITGKEAQLCYWEQLVALIRLWTVRESKKELRKREMARRGKQLHPAVRASLCTSSVNGLPLLACFDATSSGPLSSCNSIRRCFQDRHYQSGSYQATPQPPPSCTTLLKNAYALTVQPQHLPATLLIPFHPCSRPIKLDTLVPVHPNLWPISPSADWSNSNYYPNPNYNLLPYSAPPIMAMQPLQVSKSFNSNAGMENRKSILLDEEENSIIFGLLGRKCLVSYFIFIC